MTLLTGSANFIRYVLFGFNLVFVLTGIVLITVGVGVTTVYDGYESFLVTKFFQVATFLIVIGSFIFIIAFFGCCGAIKENYCMIFTFSVLLIIIFIFELSAGIAGYVLRTQASDLIQDQLNATMKDYSDKTHYDITQLWDQMQTNFNCCGLKSYKDWSKYFDDKLPISCCTIPSGHLGNYTCKPMDESLDLHHNGCLQGFADYIRSHAVSLGSAGIVLAVIQAIGTFFACYVAREVRIKNGGAGLF